MCSQRRCKVLSLLAPKNLSATLLLAVTQALLCYMLLHAATCCYMLLNTVTLMMCPPPCRFGSGYRIKLHMDPSAPSVEPMMEFMRENFHGAQLKVRRTNSGPESKHLTCIADCIAISFGEKFLLLGVYIPLPPPPSHTHTGGTPQCVGVPVGPPPPGAWAAAQTARPSKRATGTGRVLSLTNNLG